MRTVSDNYLSMRISCIITHEPLTSFMIPVRFLSLMNTAHEAFDGNDGCAGRRRRYRVQVTHTVGFSTLPMELWWLGWHTTNHTAVASTAAGRCTEPCGQAENCLNSNGLARHLAALAASARAAIFSCHAFRSASSGETAGEGAAGRRGTSSG